MKNLVPVIKERIPYINAGGCGIAALAILKWYRKHRPTKKITPVFCYRRSCKHDFIENTSGSGISRVPNHVVVVDEETNEFFDISNHTSYQLSHVEFSYKHKVTTEELLHCINRINGWNSLFDRAECVPVLERIMDVDLSEVVECPS